LTFELPQLNAQPPNPKEFPGKQTGRLHSSDTEGPHPKVLIHLPWHNFIHSGFVVELKVWPATGITNYKKIV